MLIEIKCRFSGRVLFSHDVENNTMQLTLEAAITAKIGLRNSDLSNSALSYSDLRGSDLSGVKNAQHALARTVITPDGAFIGWKKCNDNVIVKLRVPDDAKRSSASGRKCRAEFVEVLEVIGAEIGETNQHGPHTTYRIGERVTCYQWDDNRWNECSGGIHFFLTREEAEAW